MPGTSWLLSQSSRWRVARQFAGSVTSCFTTKPSAAGDAASMSSGLAPTLPTSDVPVMERVVDDSR